MTSHLRDQKIKKNYHCNFLLSLLAKKLSDQIFLEKYPYFFTSKFSVLPLFILAFNYHSV